MEYVPDPRTVIEDEADRQRFERDLAERAKRLEEERLIKVAERLARKEERERKKEEAQAARERGEGDEDMSGSGSESGGKSRDASGSRHDASSQQRGSSGHRESASEKFDDDDEFGDGNDEDYDDGVGDLPSPPQMKLELIQAIRDEMDEYHTLKAANDSLQRKIILLDDSQHEDKAQEQLLNEHKYLNTLANVHQVRYNLKETQDRYNRMASELQAKLNEKQAKCQEIENQFKDLKRTVA